MPRGRRKGKPKPVQYELIPEGEADQLKPTEPYRLMMQLIHRHHKHLDDAKIALAWRKNVRPNRDGQIELGKCRKATDLDRELREWDFVILLNKVMWMQFDEAKRLALLDHELTHAAVVIDDSTGEPKRDERGRIVYRIKKHDIEEFRDVVARHGCYKSDLADFARTLVSRYEMPMYKDDPPRREAPAPSVNGKATGDAWRSVPICSLSLPVSILDRLGEAKLKTIGDLADFSKDGVPLTQVKGIGEASADKIDTALARFWEEHPEFTVTTAKE